ncbi:MULTISPECIES: NADPH:quinone reductase [unclassified Streptomyces]|uniref:NADPH:quinone reductase n=1 Tax=unclassified Streptomyces TaxID=2593676 RepID=UPI002E28EF7C|nr:NADPH:quinone reductase [Streptomyces sp. NBC_00223]
MKAIIYTTNGSSDVLTLAERPVPEPGPGEVRVGIRVSGVNPTDWKSRQSTAPTGEQVPNQDGSGVIDAVGEGVPESRVGERVWLWEAAFQRADGTAQEYVTLPARQAVALPEHASFDLGASLGIPALTAHRALTVADGGPERLAPGALDGRTVLVAGGAGAVGNAAIQLARWAGATVITTVSSAEKATLATAAGAHHVVNYREQDAAAEIRRVAPDGVHIVVEVAPNANSELNAAVAAFNAVVAFYADDGEAFNLPVRPSMVRNIRWQGLLVYTVPAAAKDHAVAAVTAAVADRAIRVGTSAGLPLHRFPLAGTAAAHDAVSAATVGKVLIDVTS